MVERFLGHAIHEVHESCRDATGAKKREQHTHVHGPASGTRAAALEHRHPTSASLLFGRECSPCQPHTLRAPPGLFLAVPPWPSAAHRPRAAPPSTPPPRPPPPSPSASPRVEERRHPRTRGPVTKAKLNSAAAAAPGNRSGAVRDADADSFADDDCSLVAHPSREPPSPPAGSWALAS